MAVTSLVSGLQLKLQLKAASIAKVEAAIKRHMAVRISQAEDHESGSVILHVEGALTLEYALLLESMSHEVRGRLGRNVIIDLAGVTFLDEASAEVLRRLKQQPGVTFTGCQLYTRQMIEATI